MYILKSMQVIFEREFYRLQCSASCFVTTCMFSDALAMWWVPLEDEPDDEYTSEVWHNVISCFFFHFRLSFGVNLEVDAVIL